ncbi:proteasome-associated protein ECM29 homolog [Anopheles aquasalis]|uniref:proteasome-associated protein ECM29 homolog n=1 Tax=Anopheles aquasalis TaxID=42839 RepID=UPI00215B6A93|nr:proteasome-associated protein ECM29 homolog [Anopheles aquasalis]
MAGNPTEELELLERVLLRLGYADTDEQLQTTITKFLTPVLIKITSPNENVRKKVMEILTHINKRLKSRNQIQIPLAPLLTQYQQANSLFLINFAIIYITMGFPRMTVEEQTEMAPVLLNCLEGKPETHQDKILMLVLPLLGEIKIPDNPENRSELLGLSNKPHTKQQLLSILMDVLLLPYGTLPDSDVPSGMSVYTFKRVTVKPPKAEELEHLKKGIVRFLCGGIFPDPEILAHLVVASADTRFSVATPAIGELNKICSSLDWTDPKLSTPLYTLFTGNGSKIPDRKTSGVSARVRQKLLQHLLKCRGNGIITARGMQVIFESLFGEVTNQKCKVLALQFAYNLINQGDPDLINKLSQVLLTGIAKLVGTSSEESVEVQNAAYSALAQLAIVCPTTVNQDIQLVGEYFNHLQQAPVDMQSSIREALVALAQAFDWRKQPLPATAAAMETDDGASKQQPRLFAPNANQNLLLALLGEKAESKMPIVQNVASVFLTTCFPDYFVPSRYLLLIICGESAQLREMMTTYLYGVSKKDHINYAAILSVDDSERLQSANAEQAALKKNPLSSSNEPKRIVLPKFCDMVEYVAMKAERKVATIVDRMGYGKIKLPYSIDTYIEVLDYLRICLLFNAGVDTHPRDDKELFKLTGFLRRLAQDEGQRKTLVKYNDLVRRLVIARKGMTELTCLYDLVNGIPDVLVEENKDLLLTLEASLKEISEPTRALIAKVYGALLAYASDDAAFDKQVKELQTLGSKSLETRHGSLLAASNAVYRKLLIQRSSGVPVASEWVSLKQLVQLLVSLLNDQQSLLQSAAIRGLCLIGSNTVLPLPADASESMETDASTTGSTSASKTSLLETLMTLLQSAHTKAKIREDSAHCLGYLAIGDREYFARKVLERFLKLLKLTKDPALHIAIGQGLAYTLQGLPNGADGREVTDGTVGNVDDETLTWFLIELVKQVNEPHAYLRQACAIWLLAVVKNCKQRRPVLEKRQILQLALTDLLSEDNELVQDVASRALGIVYSLSDAEGQEEMTHLLLDQLIGGRRDVRKVADDTKLFEEGVLGKAPTGGKMSTYKELCNLASDLNKPDVLYEFLQIANHNATWNSKLGAAFGLQPISKSAKLEPYLGKIVPRLFRYKYDPTPKIQNSMISIWDSVVADSKATVELYYWEILEDVTTNLTAYEWRTRIACCLAVRDLIKRSAGLKLRSDTRKSLKQKDEAAGEKPAPVEDGDAKPMDVDEQAVVPEPELRTLWSQLFRVMDDCHEGTRLAAEGTANALSKVCVAASSSDHGKSGLNVASSIIPLFLESGVTHTVPEIRRLSIRTLSELIDSAGALIMPHLTSLVPCLLQATGELDSTKLTYLSTMVSGQASSGTQEAIDSLRAEAAKQHYTMETLTKCIRHIDYPCLERMTPAVLDVLKTSVNLGSKVACAHFICLVCIHLGAEMQPLSSKYLGACFGGLSDRNATVRKYYASAIGHLIGTAKDQSIIRLFGKLQELYFEQQSLRSKAVPQTIQAINKRHQEVLKDYSGHVLPLVFFAMHEEQTEESKSTVELWQELWNEINTGDAGLRLNMEAIVAILETNLNNASWVLKAQAGAATATLASKIRSHLDDSVRLRLIDLILNNVTGRTFQGKERLLQALASLCKMLDQTATNHAQRIVDAVMKECRKEEPVYRTHALRSLGNILDELKVDRFEELYNMVWHLLDNQQQQQQQDSANDKSGPSSSGGAASSSGNDGSTGEFVTSEERNKQMVISVQLKETVCETLGKAWPENSIETQRRFQQMFVEKCVQCLKLNTRPVQMCLLQSLGRFLERLHLLRKSESVGVHIETDKNTGSLEGIREKKAKVELVQDGGAESSGVLERICRIVLSAIVEVAAIPHTGLKKEALNIMLILGNKLKAKEPGTVDTELALVRQTFEQVMQQLQKDTAPEVKCRLKDLEEKLK